MNSNSDATLFIETNILPLFKGAENKNIIFAIYDIKAKLIYASNKFAELNGYDSWYSILGKTNHEIFKLCQTNHNGFHAKLDFIHQTVIKNKKLIKYISLSYYSHGFDAYTTFYIPFLNESGEVVATHAVYKKISDYNPVTQLNKAHNIRVKPNEMQYKSQYLFNLSQEDLEIIFLLNMDFTQEEIASLLEISRSKLAKIINYRIYPKLNITENHIKNLQRIVNEYGIINTIPERFLNNQIIIIESTDIQLGPERE